MDLAEDWVLAIVGAGGLGRQFKPYAQRMLHERFGAALGHLCFVEDHGPAETVNGIPCLTPDDFFDLPCRSKAFNIAITDAVAREASALRWLERGCEPFTILTQTTDFLDVDRVGVGGLFGQYTTVSANAVVGDFFHCNRYSFVGHDSVIGDYVTLSPGVMCSGNVRIGDGAFIGSGALIRNGTLDRPLVIGDGAVVGMGAVVVKDVPPYSTVVGNPARPISAD